MAFAVFFRKGILLFGFFIIYRSLNDFPYPVQPNENDIDRRRRTRRTTENDFSNLLKEYENVKDEIEKKKDEFSPTLIRVLDSDDSDQDDDIALDVLRERALESARQKLKPKVQRLKRKQRQKGTYEQMYRKVRDWNTLTMIRL